MKTIKTMLKSVVIIVMVTFVTVATTTAARAEAYPERPITMLLGYEAGGQTDLVGRAVAKVLSNALDVPVNVVNKPGAGGAVAAEQLKKAKTDGYTIMFQANAVINLVPLLNSRVKLQPEDFEYAGMASVYQLGFVAPMSAPYNNLKEFVAWAKENPGARFASFGPTSRIYASHIAKTESLEFNIVPMQGGGDMINALLGGHADLAVSGGIHYRYPEEIKTLAATTTFRHPYSPDVETIAEAGYPLGMDLRTVVMAPKGTPRPVLERISTALKNIETDAEFAKVLSNVNIPIVYMDLDAATEEMHASTQRHREVMEMVGIEPQ